MTQTSTFQPTFLQKLLGRNYKWWYILKYNFNTSLAYRTTAVFIILRDLTPIFISLGIYGSFSEKSDYLSYLLIGNIFLKIVLWFADIAWEISSNIRYGGISSKMLKPTRWLVYELFAVIGGNFYTFVINAGILLFLMAYNNISFELNLSFWLALLMVTFIASMIYYIIDLLFGSVTFWTPETNTLIELKMAITPFLAGALVIFDYNPNLNILKFLPWSFITYHPMQIYLGKYNSTETLLVFLGGIAWCVILYFLANFVFKMGLKRNESVGL
jgi:ABC-2 type transport system permease protein